MTSNLLIPQNIRDFSSKGTIKISTQRHTNLNEPVDSKKNQALRIGKKKIFNSLT
jgi:hypothetical protein